MVSLLDLSILIIALAFVILVIYLVRTLQSIRRSTEQLNQSILQIEAEIKTISKETNDLIRNTNKITLDIQEKSKSLDGLFVSVAEVGGALQQITHSVKQVSSTFTGTIEQSVNKVAQNSDKVEKIMSMVTLGLRFWDKWQQTKQKKTDPVNK